MEQTSTLTIIPDMDDLRKSLDLLIFGHEESGKSTLSGHLLVEFGGIDKRTISKLKSEAPPENKFAYVLQKIKDTLRQSVLREEYKKIWITLPNSKMLLLDEAGHRPFLWNSVSTATAGLMTVDSRPGAFERSIHESGGGREYVPLAFTMGVQQLIVAVNRMDEIQFSETRFNEIVTRLATFLKEVGFMPDNVSFVPVSALTGDNLAEPGANLPWFQGPTLIQALDGLEVPPCPEDKPLRMSVHNVYKIMGIGSVVVASVHSGVLKPGMTLTSVPSNTTMVVKSIEMNNTVLDEALPGQHVGFSFKNLSSNEPRRGDVCGSSSDDAPRAVASFEAYIHTFELPGEIRIGSTLAVSCVAPVPCKISAIKHRRDERGQNSHAISADTLDIGTAIVTLVPSKPMCLETWRNVPGLGAIGIRFHRKAVASGLVQHVVYHNDTPPPPPLDDA